MRLSSLVHGRMWGGGTVHEILYEYDHGTFVLAMHLITSEFSHMCGVYRLPLGEVSEQTNLSTAEIRQALDNLHQVEFCKFDQTPGIVWVVNMARYQIGPIPKPKDNKIKSTLRHLAGLRSTPLIGEFMHTYGLSEIVKNNPELSEFTNLVQKNTRGFEGASKGHHEAPLSHLYPFPPVEGGEGFDLEADAEKIERAEK